MPGIEIMLKLAHRWRNAAQARMAVSAALKARHPLRLHSFVLFAWTIFAGTMASHLCYALGMTTLPGRYALACAASYAAFLFGVRVWLWHVEAIPEDHGIADEPADLVDVIDFGMDGAEALGDLMGSATSDAAPAAAEGGVAVLALVALALAATVLVLLLGPEMLVDIAFEAILAGSLIGTIRLGYEPDWFLRVLGKTWWVFLLIAGLTIGFAKHAQHRYPTATTFSEVLTQMFASKK